MSDANQLLSLFSFTIDGAPPPADLVADLLEITVESSLHMPDAATIIIHDPRLRWVDVDTLAPGKALVISAKVSRDERPIFDGEIVELESEFIPGTPRVVVRAFDRLHRLGRGRHVRTFQSITDGELVRKLAQEVGLQAQVGPTKVVHPYVFQANQTNLTFLQERAASLGYLLYVRGKTLCCEVPTGTGAPIELRWGESMSEFRPCMSTLGQVSGVSARGWNPDSRQEILREVEQGHGAPQIGDSRPGARVARDAFRIEARHLVIERPVRTHEEAEQLAQAYADRSAQRFVEAEGICGGNPAIVAGAVVQIALVGDRFSGTYTVTSATHSYNAEEGYATQFSVTGLNPASLIGLLTPEAETRPGLGLSLAIVTDNQDPEGLGRVKLRYPWLSADHTSDWARVAAIGGGRERGIQFLPEIDDEVLVGFELGDIHQPYVISGLWNSIDKPPVASDQAVQGGQVQQRVIRSRAGHTIIIDDSDSGGVTIEDRNGNRIVLASADNALLIEVKGSAEISAAQSLTLKAKGSMQIEASGQLTIKGAMIDINP